MRWMWIDRVVELTPHERLVAIKNVSLAEEHLHDHFPGVQGGRAAMPIMPASLILEGMAQTAGILVGHSEGFREKVILAKIGRAELSAEALPGDRLWYTARITSKTGAGASTEGVVELERPGGSPGGPGVQTRSEIGRIEMMFSHLDQNLAGERFPEHNFVFSEGFRTLLRTSGVEATF
ncbi:MAG: beta-hydroxyacyl-ACP dehydratase [Phycisphaerales bacterium JB040]